MEPTKIPQLKRKVIFHPPPWLWFPHVSMWIFQGVYLFNNGIGSPWFSACFCVYFERLPAVPDTHFRPFFSWPKWVLVSFPAVEGNIDLPFGGGKNQRYQRFIASMVMGGEGNIFRNVGHFLETHSFCFWFQWDYSPPKNAGFFFFQHRNCAPRLEAERAGRMVQHLPPQASYASVVLVASVLSAPGDRSRPRN